VADRPAALYRRLYAPLVIEAHETLRDQARAEEIVQRAFVGTFDRYSQLADPEADVRRRVASALRDARPATGDGDLGPLNPDYKAAVAAMYAARRRRAIVVAVAATVVVFGALAFLVTRGGDDPGTGSSGSETSTGDTGGDASGTTGAPDGSAASDSTAGAGTTGATVPPTATTAATTAPPTTVGTYVVEAGDGWLSVAQKVGVPLDVLLAANNATVDDLLFVGQQLVIPAVTGPQYTVRAGDTWCGIAEKLGMPVQLLLDVNQATAETVLVPDTSIRIPDTATAATATGTPGC
jgi:LysM repeat protein